MRMKNGQAMLEKNDLSDKWHGTASRAINGTNNVNFELVTSCLYHSYMCTRIHSFQPALLTISAVESDIACQEAAESVIFFAVAHVFGNKSWNELIDSLQG